MAIFGFWHVKKIKISKQLIFLQKVAFSSMGGIFAEPIKSVLKRIIDSFSALYFTSVY